MLNDSKKITITPSPPAELILNWPVVGRLLETALPVSLGRYLNIDVLALTITGAVQGWLIREGDDIISVLFTRFDVYPRRKGVSIFCMASDHGRMADFFDIANAVITDYARKMGADFLEVQGRKGWARVLEYEERSVFLCKDIKPMTNEAVN